MSRLREKSSQHTAKRMIQCFQLLYLLLIISVILYEVYIYTNRPRFTKPTGIFHYSKSAGSFRNFSSSSKSFACFDVSPQDYHFARYCTQAEIPSSQLSTPLVFSVKQFRALESVPILWIDDDGDTRWNEAAEREMLRFLLEKQTMMTASTDEVIANCTVRKFLILDQYDAGFYSRFNCFLDQLGPTLYSPYMMLLSYRPLQVSGAGKEDFRGEGILRYFEPMSTCAKIDKHPSMTRVVRQLRGDYSRTTKITTMQDLLYENQRYQNVDSFLYTDKWKYSYEHVPHRRWLFDFHRPLTPINYSLPISALIEHKEEHIYHAPSWSERSINTWREKNGPFGEPSEFLTGNSTRPTWRDYAFTSFLRYMLVLYFHRFPWRIYSGVHMLAEHWSSYLNDKSGKTLDDMGAIFIRRGDKMPEDIFWLKHKYWRNISLYVKGLVDEEKRQNRKFSSVFIMTDDVSVMNSFLDYADVNSKGTDERYAREQLKGRNILYNVMAPQACFNPFIRAGFDQFLVSLEFLIQYSQFTISHTDSNVGMYLEKIIYSRRQLDDSAHKVSLIQNAPDIL